MEPFEKGEILGEFLFADKEIIKEFAFYKRQKLGDHEFKNRPVFLVLRVVLQKKQKVISSTK